MLLSSIYEILSNARSHLSSMKTDSCICSPMHPKCLNSAWHRVGSQQMNVEFNLILTVPRPHHFTEEEVMLPLLSLNCPEAPRIHTRLMEVALSSLLFCTTPKAVWSILYAWHFHSPLFALLIVEALEPPGDEVCETLGLAPWILVYERDCTATNRALVPLACRWKHLCIFHWKK